MGKRSLPVSVGATGGSPASAPSNAQPDRTVPTQLTPNRHRLSTALLLLACCATAAQAQDRVSDTVHNLSSAGPGDIRAESEEQVCVFCHTPHSATSDTPLWNRELPVSNYRIYRSSTFDAAPGQPTGSSKLCLSCHDGTIALGRVVSRSERIRMAGGDYIPAGLMNLGTDLSDDHPVSFHYTPGLAAADRQLKNPNTVPAEVKLDADGQLQCTTCHDAHGSKYRMFLTWDDAFGALCETCHDMTGWRTGSHKTSSQDVSGITDTDWPYATVAENACRSCHRSHTAGNPERLLLYRLEEDNCLNCHNGRAARHDMVTQLNKFSTHDPRRYTGIHDPAETWSGDRPHVECVDCHNPHAADQPTEMRGYTAIGETMKAVPGISIGGRPVLESRFEYEVCFRCHGDQPVPITRRVSRQSDQANMRLKFRATNPSFHPLVTASVGRNAASLDPSIPRGSLIRCTDCHNNDDGPRADGAGPDGPHGSIYPFLLERNHSTADDTPESTFAYALCYKCHRRASILADESFPTHALHVRDNNTPCSACHDPHGVSRITGTRSDHTHLINFDTTIVRPLTGTTRLRFVDLGNLAGSCTLTCHGTDHDNLEYGR